MQVERRAAAAAPALIWQTDPDLRIIALQGRVPDELLGGRPHAIGHAAHDLFGASATTRTAAKRAHQRALRGETALFDVEIGDRFHQARVEPLIGERGTITGTIGVAMDITERRQMETKLRDANYYDDLTKLPNRNMAVERLQKMLGARSSSGRSLAVVYIDIDRFREANNTLGRNAANRILLETASRLRRACGGRDFAARLNADRFLLILKDGGTDADIAGRVRAIINLLKWPIELDGFQSAVTCSAGVSRYPKDGSHAETLIASAETALVTAKRRGDSVAMHDSEMLSHAASRFYLQGDLKRALAQQEFFVLYQPIVNSLTFQTVGVEALTRWRHPKFGKISPKTFIPIAEECGAIGELGEWMLYHVLTQAQRWRERGLPELRINLNLSAKQFNDPQLTSKIRSILKDTQFPPWLCEFEITETALLENTNDVSQTIEELKAIGARIALDDFGTGFSSLSLLKKIPMDSLKIDQSFISDIQKGASDAEIVRAITALARSLSAETIAEGVQSEDLAQHEVVRECDLLQGFHYGRPMGAEAFEHHVQGRKL